jgi:hypothetical protein
MPTSRARDKSTGVARRPVPVLLAGGGPGQAIQDLAARFASFSTTVQTRYDNGGSPAGGTGVSLQSQVSRALTQATRTMSPPVNGNGYGSNGYGSNGSGPNGSGSNGYGPNGSGSNGYGRPGMEQRPSVASALRAGGVLTGSGGGAALDPAQQVLAGEAAIVRADLLAALDALTPLSTITDPADVASYRAVVRTETELLVSEFARPDGARPAKVRVLLGGLLGWEYAVGNPPGAALPGPGVGDVAALLFLLNLGAPVVPSARTEEQVALQQIVAADAIRLFTLWTAYQYAPPGALGPPLWLTGGIPRTPGIGGLSALAAVPVAGGAFILGTGAVGALRVGMYPGAAMVFPPPPIGYSAAVITADLLLPVLGADGDQVAGALDAVGFGTGPQEITPMTGLNSDVDVDRFGIGPTSPAMPVLGARTAFSRTGLTVRDVLDWVTDLASASSYDTIESAGQLGIDLLADQADELFWIVVAMLTYGGIPELADAQVQLELTNLARDLNALATLSN